MFNMLIFTIGKGHTLENRSYRVANNLSALSQFHSETQKTKKATKARTRDAHLVVNPSRIDGVLENIRPLL